MNPKKQKAHLIDNKILTGIFSDTDQIDVALYMYSNRLTLVEFEIFFTTDIAFNNMVNAESISLVQDPELRKSLSLHYSDSDLNSGTQERLKELTRTFSDRIIFAFNHKELIDSRYSVSSDLPSLTSLNLKSDPQIFGGLTAMRALMRDQNLIMESVSESTITLITMIDDNIENS